MTQEQVREALRQAVTEPEPSPDLLTRVTRELRRRRGRRTAWRATGGTLCAVVLVVVVALVLGAPRPRQALTQPIGRPVAHDCAAADLSVTWGTPIGVQAGSEFVWVGLRNTSAGSCTLPDSAPTSLKGSLGPGRGYRAILTTTMSAAESAAAARLTPVTILRPGEPAGFVLNLPDPGACGSGAISFTRLRFSLTPQVSLTVAPRHLVSACGPIGVSRVGVRTLACTNDQLTLDLSQVSPQTGEHAFYLRVTNRGDTSCTLRGRPSVTFVDATGKNLPLRQTTKSQYFRDRPVRTITLAPHHHTYAEVAKYRCDLGTIDTAATVRVLLPGADRPRSLSLTGDVGMGFCKGGRNDPGQTYAVSTLGPLSTLYP